MRRPALALAALATAGALVMSACAGGGANDSAAGAAAPAGAKSTTLNLYAYSTPKPGFDKVIPAFAGTEAGKGVQFEQSYGPSGDQSRKVAAGAPADVVLFSLEPDVTRLVGNGLVDPTWNAGEHHGVPVGSVVALVVRKGNPKGIHGWDDLLKPGVEVVTPNPFSSGGAKWNLLAPYAAKSQGGKDRAAGLAYIDTLITQHVKVQPKSAREATETFLQGTGDVLISYEAEAINAERKGDPIQHFIPSDTFKIENPVAVLKNGSNVGTATAFRDYLYTAPAQKLWAQAGFRPVDPTVAASFASDFPAPQKLWTIEDLGGWKKVDKDLFAKGSGAIALIYDKATS
jgi:sulfate transport system substrate-binding protein